MIDLRVDDRIATLTLNRPPVNAFDNAWVARWHALLDDLDARDDWHVLHVRSAQACFCAGADLAQVRERFDAPDRSAQILADTAGFQRLFARVEALPCVTLAEINGPALGGGLELALACDLRIAADSAKLGLPEVRLGLLPGAGGTQRLTRLCGPGVAARLVLGAEIVTGPTALALGLVQWSVPVADLADMARTIVRSLADLPPAALRAAKSCLGAAAPLGSEGFAAELAATQMLMDTPETQARIRKFLAGVRPRDHVKER
jgi:enoyl-CoA hydratase/carnithine racemase